MGVDLFWDYSEPHIKDRFIFQGEAAEVNKNSSGNTPAGFNYFRGLDCSQMSLWRRQSSLQKQVPGGLSCYRACRINCKDWSWMARAAKALDTLSWWVPAFLRGSSVFCPNSVPWHMLHQNNMTELFLTGLWVFSTLASSWVYRSHLFLVSTQWSRYLWRVTCTKTHLRRKQHRWNAWIFITKGTWDESHLIFQDTEQKITKPSQFTPGFCKPRGSNSISLALLVDVCVSVTSMMSCWGYSQLRRFLLLVESTVFIPCSQKQRQGQECPGHWWWTSSELSFRTDSNPLWARNNSASLAFAPWPVAYIRCIGNSNPLISGLELTRR